MKELSRISKSLPDGYVISRQYCDEEMFGNLFVQIEGPDTIIKFSTDRGWLEGSIRNSAGGLVSLDYVLSTMGYVKTRVDGIEEYRFGDIVDCICARFDEFLKVFSTNLS